MVMAFTIDVPAALVFVVTIPLLAAVVFGVMLWTLSLIHIFLQHGGVVVSDVMGPQVF